MKSFKIPFAYDSAINVIDISMANKVEVYKCNCGADVKLRGGEIISNHFYHINETGCSLESAIHKAYKSVLSNVKKIKLPYQVDQIEYLEFDKVELEKQIDDYIPDAIGYIGGKRYIIEFAKSSYIGERKKSKIKKSNLFCIEVDIIKNVTTIKEIEQHLLNESYYKHLIHIPEYDELRELRDLHQLQINELNIRNNNEMHKLTESHREKINSITYLSNKGSSELKESHKELKAKLELWERELRHSRRVLDDCELRLEFTKSDGTKIYRLNLGNYNRITAEVKDETLFLEYQIA